MSEPEVREVQPKIRGFAQLCLDEYDKKLDAHSFQVRADLNAMIDTIAQEAGDRRRLREECTEGFKDASRDFMALQKRVKNLEGDLFVLRACVAALVTGKILKEDSEEKEQK